MGTSAADNQANAVSDGVIHAADDHSGVIHAAEQGAPSSGGAALTVDDVLANPDRARSLEFVHHVEQQGGTAAASSSGTTSSTSDQGDGAAGPQGASGIPAPGTTAQPSSATVRSVTVTLGDGSTQTLSAQ